MVLDAVHPAPLHQGRRERECLGHIARVTSIALIVIGGLALAGLTAFPTGALATLGNGLGAYGALGMVAGGLLINVLAAVAKCCAEARNSHCRRRRYAQPESGTLASGEPMEPYGEASRAAQTQYGAGSRRTEEPRWGAGYDHYDHFAATRSPFSGASTTRDDNGRRDATGQPV